MKLIKKMLAIMFAFMMVVGMGTKVNAEDESTTATTGTITIDNAVDGQNYSIYKILELESYDKGNGLYSYKPVDAWKEFFQVGDATVKGAGSDFVTIDENGYATWKNGADVKTFANLALKYAKEKKITPVSNPKIENKELEFSGLEFGYYLVDSSVGTLCGLDTTKPSVKIKEKNGVPTVKKLVSSDNGGYSESNFANIGDTVYFQTSITAQAGAQNYALHDTMSVGLTLNKESIHIKYENDNSDIDAGNYTINCGVDSEKRCFFDITFTEGFCNTLTANQKIVVTYSAILNDKALIYQGNVNETQLSYGDNQKTTESITNTYTSQIPVFKYTLTEGKQKALAGAKFKLYDVENNGTAMQFIQKVDTQDYRKALSTETAGVIAEITTDGTGKFNIQGLKPGTYWLEETAAPNGYNKLAKRIKIELNEHGNVKIDNKDTKLPISIVEVENKTGTLLPSTGGMGTTMIYMAGAILVIASGIVLVSKKRSKAK